MSHFNHGACSKIMQQDGYQRFKNNNVFGREEFHDVF